MTTGDRAMEDDVYKKVGRRLGDISDLPEGLRKLLKSAKLDDFEEKILSTIKTRYDGVASIDEIMVGLYRDFQYVVDDRRMLAGKLYRMTKSGHLERVEKRKGVFRVK